jgi:selenocysteine lyase/cysteine desulfurase
MVIWACARSMEQTGILTPENRRIAQEGTRPARVKYDELQKTLLEKHRIITRMVPENGLNCNRISTHIYNSIAEVDRFLEALNSLV